MANIHTECPKRVIGEANLARQLAAIDDRRLHLWFALDDIPGVRDIDCVIWHEQVGVFIVEIKAVNLPMLEEFGLRSCRIRGRARKRRSIRHTWAKKACCVSFARGSRALRSS